MIDTPPKQGYKLVSKQGIIAGIICATIPLAITATLLFNYLTKKTPVDGLFLWVTFIIFTSIIIQIIIWIKTNKYYKLRMAGDHSPPTDKQKMFFGAASGFMAHLTCLPPVLLWVYFSL